MRVASLVLVLSIFGCSGSGKSFVPKTAGEVLGEKACVTVPAEGRPLIVDWNQDDRVALEARLRRSGIAVVRYACDAIELLPDCHVEGEYGYTAVTVREKVERLSGDREISVNLPVAGVGLAAKLGGSSGTKHGLDIALVTVGERRTTKISVERKALEGKCAGATHFVRGTTVGAFAVRAATDESSTVGASVFGLGAQSKSASSSVTTVSDGTLDACRSGGAEALSPPVGCGAPLRLHLVALDGGGASCPTGFVWTGEKCAADATVPHECERRDLADCTSQCERFGQPGSCHALARALYDGEGIATDPVRAVALYRKNCDAGYAKSCGNLGIASSEGRGSPKDPVAAARFFDDACSAGTATACSNLGAMYFDGQEAPENLPLAVRLFLRACNGGEAGGCHNLGVAYANGKGVPHDEERAVAFARRACDGGLGRSCLLAGVRMRKIDAAAGKRFLEEACAHGAGEACGGLSEMYRTGDGVPKDPVRALEVLQRSCDAGYKEACGATRLNGVMDSTRVRLGEIRAFFQRRCEEQHDETGCGMWGNSLLDDAAGTADRPKGLSLLRGACAKKSSWACERLKKLGESP